MPIPIAPKQCLDLGPDGRIDVFRGRKIECTKLGRVQVKPPVPVNHEVVSAIDHGESVDAGFAPRAVVPVRDLIFSNPEPGRKLVRLRERALSAVLTAPVAPAPRVGVGFVAQPRPRQPRRAEVHSAPSAMTRRTVPHPLGGNVTNGKPSHSRVERHSVAAHLTGFVHPRRGRADSQDVAQVAAEPHVGVVAAQLIFKKVSVYRVSERVGGVLMHLVEEPLAVLVPSVIGRNSIPFVPESLREPIPRP